MTDDFEIIKNVTIDQYNYKQFPHNTSIDVLKKYVLNDPHAVGFSSDGMIKFHIDLTKFKPGASDLYLHKARMNQSTDIPQIPKRIHFIWFCMGRPFNIVNYLAIKAAIQLHSKDYTITLHCDATPVNNIYFDNLMATNRLAVKFFKDPEYINGHYVQYYQNRADYIRLTILKELGGIYMDTDLILLRKLDCFLNNKMVMGYERQDNKDFVCNAVIMAIPNHPMITEWLYMYEKSWGAKFIGWYIGHSLIMGSELCQKYRHMINIVPHDTFYPFTWINHSIIEDKDNGETYNNSFSVHLWDTEFQKTRLLPESLDYFRTKKNALTRLFGHYIESAFPTQPRASVAPPPNMGGDEEFMVLENMDMIGNDLEFHGGKSINELMALCKAEPKCVAFNSLGFLKYKVEIDKLCNLTERGFENCKATDALYIYKPRFQQT